MASHCLYDKDWNPWHGPQARSSLICALETLQAHSLSPLLSLLQYTVLTPVPSAHQVPTGPQLMPCPFFFICLIFAHHSDPNPVVTFFFFLIKESVFRPFSPLSRIASVSPIETSPSQQSSLLHLHIYLMINWLLVLPLLMVDPWREGSHLFAHPCIFHI